MWREAGDQGGECGGCGKQPRDNQVGQARSHMLREALGALGLGNCLRAGDLPPEALVFSLVKLG